MGYISDPNWKLPKMPLKKLNPKHLQQTLTPLPAIYLSKDVPRRDICISYLNVTKSVERSEGKLAHKRQRYQNIVQKLSNQWTQLVQSENNLRNLVIVHSKFVRDNMEKRTRANMRVQQNMRLIQTRQEDINTLRKQMEVAHFLLSEFRREIEKHDKYDVFLTNFIDMEDCPFRTIYDLLKKYEVLLHVKAVRENEQSLESLRVVKAHKDMNDIISNGNVFIIGLRNDLNNLRCKYDDIARKNLTTESLIASIVSRTNELNAEVSTCQYMIDAMYRYMCHRRKLPLVEYTLREVQPKIEILKSTLGGWEKIWNSAEIANRNKKKTREGRKSAAWKQSVSQAVLTWKKKATSEAQILQSFMQASSLFRR